MGDFFQIVIPVHNEATFLPGALSEMRAAIREIGADPQILLIENGSTDETLEVARGVAAVDDRVAVAVLPEANYGAAMREGLLQAKADWVVTFDIDYYSARFISQLRELRDEADVVIASKRAPGSRDERSRLRRLGTAIFNRLVRTVLGTEVSDTHGVKAFRSSVIRELAPLVQMRDDLFDTELVLRAERAGYRVAEVPVTVREQRRARSSYLKRVPGAVRGVLQLRSALPSRERRNTTSR